MSLQNWLAENLSRIDQRAAGRQHRARSQHTTDAVIHGQAVVQPVARLSVHHAREPQPHCITRAWLTLAALGIPVVPDV